MADDACALAAVLAAGPVVVKPYQGGGGHGVRIAQRAAELDEPTRDGKREPAYAQRYMPPDATGGPADRKLYVIGGEVFGVRKIFPRQSTAERSGEPYDPTPEERDVALRCGRAFGIDLFGVDLVQSGGQTYVVDMASLPGCRGVPDAPRLLARYFAAAARRAMRGGPAAAAPEEALRS